MTNAKGLLRIFKVNRLSQASLLRTRDQFKFHGYTLCFGLFAYLGGLLRDYSDCVMSTVNLELEFDANLLHLARNLRGKTQKMREKRVDFSQYSHILLSIAGRGCLYWLIASENEYRGFLAQTSADSLRRTQ